MYENILIATFSVWKDKKRTSINGMIEPLLSFFMPKTKRIDLIDGPHPGSSFVISKVEIYASQALKSKRKIITSFMLQPFLKLTNENGTHIAFKLRDFLSVVEWGLRSQKRYDLFIGLESIFTLAGILLKKIGLIKQVVYYVSDYSPTRFSNKILNTIYLFLDRVCCYHADFIWDVSPAMYSARLQAGLDPKRSSPVILVPNALFPEQISYLPVEKITPYSLVFAGTFGPENGVPLAIEAMKDVIEKFPKSILHILGGGHTPDEVLKELAKKTGVAENVVFHGFIHDATKLSSLIGTYMVGIAPYREYGDSARLYADATKLRLYMGAGLPVITTHVPPLGKEVEKHSSGLVVGDSKEELANAVIRIFSGKKLYLHLRSNAIKYAKTNTWENSYTQALEQMRSKTVS